MKRALIAVMMAAAAAVCAASDSLWRYEAVLSVKEAGLVEVPLIPGLHESSLSGLDLRVLGPDSSELPFELYRRSDPAEEAHEIREIKAGITDGGTFIWEGAHDKEGEISLLRAYLSAQDYVAKANIYGRTGAEWKLLAADEALYNMAGVRRAEVKVPAGTYTAFRLEFVSYDEKYKKTPSPLSRLEAVVEKKGLDYFEQAAVIKLKETGAGSDREKVLEFTLPGRGLFVKEIRAEARTPFVGEWKLEAESIMNGKRVFKEIKSGSIPELKKGSVVFQAPLGIIVPSDRLRLTLSDKWKRDFVVYEKCEAILILPRLVFRAGSPGDYRVQSGCGRDFTVSERPSEPDRPVVAGSKWKALKENPEWKPEDLVEKYKLRGAEFKDSGYTWEAPVMIPEPGYYRVVLGACAALGRMENALRIVKDNRQVPYFYAGDETGKINLVPEEKFNSRMNTSEYEIRLQAASGAWKCIRVSASGIFSRKVKVETRFSGAVVWEPYRAYDWKNSDSKEAVLEIPFPDGGSAEGFKILIDHGDNTPLVIGGMQAEYSAPVVCFLADQAGVYKLTGGNSRAERPRYDLDLVQYVLLSREPAPVLMGECSDLKKGGPAAVMSAMFKNTKWALYLVLAAVTILLFIIVARLFPAVDGGKTGKEKNRKK